MEVFLKNVPPYLTIEALTTELEPFMAFLSITDWACDKPNRKTRGWITFLKHTDGEKFLQKHEKVPGQTQATKSGGVYVSRDIARLHITKTPIFVQKSARSVGKDTLAYLKHEREKRTQTQQAAAPRVERNPVLPSFMTFLHKISCGTNVFRGEEKQLTFAMQTSLNTFCTARFNKRAVIILATGQFRLDIPNDTIVDFIVSRQTYTATLVLSEPPRFFAPLHPLKENNFANWSRRQACPTWQNHVQYSGCCLVYRLDINGAQQFETFVKSLKERDVISITNDDLPVTVTPEPHLHDYQTSLRTFEGKMQELGRKTRGLPFAILFQLVALVWNNYLQPSSGTVMAEMMSKLAADAQREKHPLPFTVESMKKLFAEIPYPISGTEPEDLDVSNLVRRLIQVESDLRSDNPLRDPTYGIVIPDHQAWVMKAMITPTRIFLHGPEAESKNSILRKHSDNTEYFIRCLFADDDGQDLSFNPRVSNDVVYERYRTVLSGGIRIAGRHFDFLGFSHSSLRSHSVWFMATFVDNNLKQQKYDTIIKGLGNFEDIRVPAKCAARIGQAFSETPYAVPIFDVGIQMRYIPDVKTKNGKRVFSDGVGTISSEAMRELWSHLPVRSNAATCFQIRWSGAKGVLALDPTLRGKTFCIRKESMVKFDGTDVMQLGICDTASRPLRLWLNRQMIKILEDMGTSDEWFMGLQNRELKVLRAVTAQAVNTSTFLRCELIGTGMGLPGLIIAMDRLGLDFRRDVFLKTVVEHVVLRELRLLKHKARIPVDKGVTLFGIMDETGYLKEGEVFVTFDKADRIDRPPRKAPCLVTRSPALHPGDIRVVKMVTPPADSPLRQLRNCIVFSQHGERDLPSQLSGGDLDGDLYSVIWDTGAMPKRMFSPADYPRVTPRPLNRSVNRDDMADFFINFMKTDVLGVIANRHQILADFTEKGTADEGCVKLAELHSTAVDSSKTGIPVNVRDLPKAPKARPDFFAPAPPLKLYDIGQIAHIAEDEDKEHDDGDDMGMAKHRYYESKRILGKLYRNVDESNIWQQDIRRGSPDTENEYKSLWMDLFETSALRNIIEVGRSFSSNYERQLPEAWKIRNRYEGAIEDAMWQFSDNPRKQITEVEVFCGFILNNRGNPTRRQRDASIKLRETTDQIMDHTVQQIRDAGPRQPENAPDGGESNVEGPEPKLSNKDVLELCLACLIVACFGDPTREEAYNGSGKLQSFKLVAASCLIKEMTSQGLLSPLNNDDGGSGGFVSVGGNPQRAMTLPVR